MHCRLCILTESTGRSLRDWKEQRVGIFGDLVLRILLLEFREVGLVMRHHSQTTFSLLTERHVCLDDVG